MKKYFLVFWLFLFGVSLVVGQHIDYDFPAMRWNMNYGLKSYNLIDIDTDSKGIIWVSTIEGVYQHQGTNFQNLNSMVENSPFDDPIETTGIYIDNKDRMWITTVENGLLMYNIPTNNLKHYDDLIDGKVRMSDLRVYGLHVLNDSIIRFTSHTHGLIDYNPNQHNFKLIEVFTDSLQLKKHNGFQRMLRPILTKEHTEVKNWYASLSGMVHYDEKRDSFIYYRNGGEIGVRKAVVDSDSIAWFVTYGLGLYSFDLRTKHFENYRCFEGENWSHGCLTGGSIEIYNDSTLILDSNDKLYFFNKNDKTFVRFNSIIHYGLWSGITSNMKWINGELWQASYSSGLYRHFVDDHGVRSIFASRWIDEVYFDKERERYISVSLPNLITLHNKKTHKEIRIPNTWLNEGQDFVEGVTIDDNDNFWIVTSTKVLLYNEKTGEIESPFDEIFAPVMKEISFRNIEKNPNGTIWISSYSGTIFTFDPITMEHKFYGGTTKGSIPLEYHYRTRFEQFTDDGYVWYSAQDGIIGISPYDNNHKFCKNLIDRKTNLPVNIISPSFGINKRGKVIFGSSTRAMYIVDVDSLNGGFIDHIELEASIPDLSINHIKIDDNETILVSTKKGLIQINSKTNFVELYGDTHRLFDIRKLQIQDGKFPIAIAHDRFLIINPEELKPFPGKSNIQLQNVEIDAKELLNMDGSFLKNGDKISLGPNDNFLRFQFNDFNYVSQKQKTYAIKIEGLHDEWIELKERSEFGISGFPGGDSEVMVKSKLQFAKEYSEPIKLLTVHVTPPLIHRKEFWAFCAGLLLLLFYLGYRYRLSQLKEKQNLMIAFNKQLAETEMKALRAQMNPHFLFNVLNAIKLNVQKNQQEDAIDFITDFSKLIRSVLQNSGKKRITLEEELHTLELYVKIERKRFSTSFNYDFTIDESINTKQITIPPMLLQPYVENAIWHGILHKIEGNGEIKINTHRVENSIVIEISDNGIGRDQANKLKLKSAQRTKSMGMQITKDRMAISNKLSSDHIDVKIVDLYDESGESSGTKVVIILRQEN